MEIENHNPYDAPRSDVLVKTRSKAISVIVFLVCLYLAKEALITYMGMIEYSKPWTNIWVIQLCLIFFYAISVLSFALSKRLSKKSVLISILGLAPIIALSIFKNYGIAYFFPKEMSIILILLVIVLYESKHQNLNET